VLGAPDAVTEIDNQNGGELRVTRSNSLDAAVVMVTAMPEINLARAYQLWGIEGTQPTSVGVLAAGRNTGLQLVEGVRAYDTIAMTLEQAGGATTPNLPPVRAVQF
jgi:anti-sigma-K factor RskA